MVTGGGVHPVFGQADSELHGGRDGDLLDVLMPLLPRPVSQVGQAQLQLHRLYKYKQLCQCRIFLAETKRSM